MSFIGKVFLLAALLGYSYLLLTDPALGKKFETKYASFQEQALVKQYIPADVFKHVPALLAKQVVSGLLASSPLLFICGGFAVFPVLGLLLQITIQSNPLFSADQYTKIDCLKLVALIGGVIVWASSRCCSKQTPKPKTE
ncbi:unnamed protein product (macronuclear) [Paramecium tetraurelia]|uniref:Uncharacterized protein n=1 Tax=Paramecium tetraurelia TaxID=5888 RepID=A0E6X2_PARTE|nr:uncharacterized protein GSPATT00023767001 [Paramecium tetraurelia]CAK91039.1 unnamed protein product [Paramecium tetraurelia]|eukprot:XP_001458436.1 hypothetical protein (macronuclear) [Paramecium tetraurelia strain d4-2]